MDKILITGGAGFIGSHLADKLLVKNFQVISVDSFDNYYLKKFKLANIQTTKKNNNYSFYHCDIRSSMFKKILKKYSPFYCVIHLAARAGVRPSLIHPALYERNNIGGTYELLQSISSCKIRQLIFASSSSVYGNGNIPFSESEPVLRPVSVYGATKLAGEQICDIYHRMYNIPTTILRFFSVYGPRGRPDMAPYLFVKALYNQQTIKQFGDGSSMRDWTYIDDIIDGIVRAIKNSGKFQIINLGGNKPVKLATLLDTIEDITGKKFNKINLPKRLDEPAITFADIRKAKKLLHWEPRIKFTEGMSAFINWYKTNRL